jgi:hypothetical protein
VSDHGQLLEGFQNFDHEWDGSPYKEHVGGDPVGDRQMDNGPAKAIYKVLPTLSRASAITLPVWPNPSVLIRKIPDNELDPMKPNGL